MDLDLVAEITAAERRIRDLVRETPVEPSPFLASGRGSVLLKLENLQRTGSFKIRGAANAVLSLSAEERRRGVVAASSGNHGTAVACAARAAGCGAVVFVPRRASASKVAAIREQGGEVVEAGDDCLEAELRARAWAAERGAAYLSPYNDAKVIAGQGTLAVELTRQVPRCDSVYVAAGGGGLLAGVGTWLRSRWPETCIVAASPAAAPVLHESLAAGRVVDTPSLPTLSDATAGGLEPDTITLEPCRRVVDRSLTVDEDAIARALRLVLERHHTLIEGAAAVAVAAFLQDREERDVGDAAVILCGANIDPDTLCAALARGAERR